MNEQYFGINSSLFNSTRIRNIRFSYHLTQVEFANLLDISVKTLQNWEQGRYHPCGSACTLLDIAERYSEIIFQRKKLSTVEEMSKELKSLFNEII